MPISRRAFLQWLAGTGVALGTSGAGFKQLLSPREDSEQLTTGISTWYATTCRECPAGCGMVVRNREGRVVKCEGNPHHPINQGRLCARGQAALQGLYDPDRIRGPLGRTRGGKFARCTWDEATAALGKRLAAARPGGIAIISDLQTGSLADFFRRWLQLLGCDRYLVYEPIAYESVREAHRAVYGQDKIPTYRIADCDFLISFGVDFLEAWISPVRAAREFAQMRTPRNGRMGTFVYAGPRLSATAACADRPYLIPPGHEAHLALAMLHVIAREGLARVGADALKRATVDHDPETIAPLLGMKGQEVRLLARAFGRASFPLALGGVGPSASTAAVEAATAAALLNAAVNSRAVDFSGVHALSGAASQEQVGEFLAALAVGEVDLLFIFGANPAFAIPPRMGLAEALKNAKTVVSLSSVMDETAELAHWVLPVDTALESWGDYEPEPGVLGLSQPTMGRLFDSRHAADILLMISDAAGCDAKRALGARNFHEFVERQYGRRFVGDGTREYQEAEWQAALRDGGRWWHERRAPAAPTPENWPKRFPGPTEREALSLWTYPSPALHDGRGANQRWLQELPEALVHGVWASWVELHPETASPLGIRSGDVVRLAGPGGKVEAPAFVWRGIAPHTAGLALGQGHTSCGRYARGRGANAFALLGSADSGALFCDVELRRTGKRKALVTTSRAESQYGRGLAQAVALSGLVAADRGPLSLPLPQGYTAKHDIYKGHPHKEHRWAMAVDLNRCTGCGACVVACYAENNVAVVGEKLVSQGRIMSWIRIDRYFDWQSRESPVRFLPMLCQHCDSAPCESVCPVFATAHSEDGLNMMIYNRCIGTRYCSNNCPYKVRRFNWFAYDWPGALRWQLNPDLSVRGRGVMEKCTFCVQRIREATQRAKVEGRRVADGDIMPACAQTCPADALVFGDLMDPRSRVSRIIREDPRCYQVLHELNTKPAVIYLKKVVNDLSI